jgi:hypothetical protein
VKNLDVVEDLLDEDWMMEVVMRQGWTLALLFGVGWSDKDVIEETKFGQEEVHSYELGAVIGLATQSFQGMGEISVWRHGRLIEVWMQQQIHRSSTLRNF